MKKTRFLARFWAWLVDGITVWISSFLFFLGYIRAAFDSDKEAWHDKLFDTWVIDN